LMEETGTAAEAETVLNSNITHSMRYRYKTGLPSFVVTTGVTSAPLISPVRRASLAVSNGVAGHSF